MIQRRVCSRARLVRVVRTTALVGACAWLALACESDDTVVPSLGQGSLQPEPAVVNDPEPPPAPPPAEPAPAPVDTPNEEGIGGTPPLDPPPPDNAGPNAPSGNPPANPPPVEPPPANPPPVEPPPAEPPPAEPPPPPPPIVPGELSCEPGTGAVPGLRLTQLASGLDQPTFVTAAPGDERRLFVLERSGAIRVLLDGVLQAEPFLNLREKVSTSNEEGLVGLAFHPDYANNGRFFVQYALLDPNRAEGDDQEIILSEFARDGQNADLADAASETRLMVVEQPADIHLAGMLAFGPTDGMLYISRGDGGTTGSQDVDDIHGKILRIDVDTTGDGEPYGIPEGNMTGGGVLPEIWSLGFRNPWRFSFDPCTADMYIGDVGESSFEEVDFEPANTPGRNYGWNTVEGPSCFESMVCDPAAFTLPVLSYSHDEGCTVISGYVYRGSRIPALRGTYFYADYCSGFVRTFRVEGGAAVGAQDITADINPDDVNLFTSFGVDNGGEMYVVSQTGTLFRIDPD